MGHIDQTTGSTTITWQYQYDAAGNKTQAITPQGIINYQYDPATEQLIRTWTASNAAPTIPVTDTRYDYDSQGRLLHVIAVTIAGTAVSGQTISWYGQAITGAVTAYAYDAIGNLKDIDQSNGVITAYTYDDLNRLTKEINFVDGNGDGVYTVSSSDVLKGEFDYVLNTDGTRKQETDTNDLDQSSSYAWTYDALQRLTGETYTNTVDTSASYNKTYSFDLTGNRLQTITQKQVGTATDTITTTDRYDNDDRLLSEKSVDAATAANDTFTTYAYGGTSNPGTQLTNETVYGGTDTTGAIQSVTQYQYNLQGQMSQASVNTSTSSGTSHSTSTYGYDPDGNRVSQTVVSDNGVPTAPVTTSTTYLVDENNPTGYAQTIEEFTNNSTAPSRTYVIGMDVIAQNDSHGLLTFLYDGHGSTRALVNTAGQVQQRFAYDAYGNQLSASNLTAAAAAFTTLLYSGQQTDPSTGLQYLRARYYSSTMGRFTTYDSYAGNSQDPLSLHKYLYADANPINGWDPSGKFGVLDFVVGAALTGGLVGSLMPAANIEQQIAHTISYGLAGATLALLAVEALPTFLIGAGLVSGNPQFFEDAADEFLGGQTLQFAAEGGSEEEASITSEIEATASKYGPLECVDCSRAIQNVLRQNGQQGIPFGIRANDGADYMMIDGANSGQAITQNGYHEAVEYEGKIFDNFFPNGIDKNEFFSRLIAPFGWSIVSAQSLQN